MVRRGSTWRYTQPSTVVLERLRIFANECLSKVLERYETTYDPQHPVVCMDEQPVQLLLETGTPIAATKEHAKRVDYEYERHGTASIFMFAEPLSGFR